MVPFEIAYGTMNKIFKLDNWIKGGMKSPLAARENWLNVDGLGVVNVDKAGRRHPAAYGQLFKRRGPKAFRRCSRACEVSTRRFYGKLRETMMGMSDDVLALAKKGATSAASTASSMKRSVPKVSAPSGGYQPLDEMFFKTCSIWMT